METAIVAAGLGLLISAAAIGVPQLIRLRHHGTADEDGDTLEYLKNGRSAREIAQSNAAVREHQQNGIEQ